MPLPIPSHPATIRLTRFAHALGPVGCRVVAAVAVTVIAILGAALVLRSLERPQNASLTIALILREEQALSERILQTALEELVQSHNLRGDSVPLRLEVLVSDKGTRLGKQVDGIGSREDVVAVIDNSWGVELGREEVRSAYERLGRAVVFLNGDRFTGAVEPAHRPWVFLGASDHIPGHMQRLVEQVRGTQRSVPVAVFIERSAANLPYAPARKTLDLLEESLREAPGGPGMAPPTEIPLPCVASWELPDRYQLTEARSKLIAAAPDPTGPGRKIVVLYTHATWGSELIRWIDSAYRNTTIIAYQSAISRDRQITLRERTGNELVLLSQSTTAAPRPLLDMHRGLQPRHPQMLTSPDADIFYLRRAVVAFEIVERAVRASRSQAANVDLPDIRQVIARRAASKIADLKEHPLSTQIGLIPFDASGVERGNNHIILRRGKDSDSYPLQLGDTDQFLPNLQVLLSHVRVSDLDIRQGIMRVNLILHVRFDTDTLLKALGPGAATPDPESSIQQLESQMGRLLRFGNLDEVDFTQRLLNSRKVGRLTELEFSVAGTSRLREMDPWWYPFDTHTIHLPLHILEPSDRVRVSVDPRQRSALADSRDAELAGWTVQAVDVTIDHEATMIPGEENSPSTALAQAQFSSVDLNFVLRRRPWSASLLVYLPLLLVCVGSTAVLYIQIGGNAAKADGETGRKESAPQPESSEAKPTASDANPPSREKKEPEPDNAEILKTQSELCLGCVLAVVTYLISYAGLVPRLERPLYCDLLLGATLVIVSANFIFVVAVADRKSNRFLEMLSMDHYRTVSALTCALVFGLWLYVGLL
ncbi:MAG: hypothetical protein JNL10_09545 [Verrucomicrobiales bacterium]|nr:hypothetical protein [Verrucomicrobiales bacterium]